MCHIEMLLYSTVSEFQKITLEKKQIEARSFVFLDKRIIFSGNNNYNYHLLIVF